MGATAAIDFGGTTTDVVVRRPDGKEQTAALPAIARPGGDDVERLLHEVGSRDGMAPGPIELVAVTGGRSQGLPAHVADVRIVAVDEAEATAAGGIAGGVPTPAVVGSLGTGTGIVLAEPPAPARRLVGSGVGGGTLLGLARLLLGTNDVAEIGRLARAGSVTRCDLTVGDILGGGAGSVSAEATASHFARVGRPGSERPSREDIAAALLNLVGQSVLRLAFETLASQRARSLVLVGHLLDVPGFRDAIFRIPGLDPGSVRIPPEPGFAVARGALAIARRTG